MTKGKITIKFDGDRTEMKCDVSPKELLKAFWELNRLLIYKIEPHIDDPDIKFIYERANHILLDLQEVMLRCGMESEIIFIHQEPRTPGNEIKTVCHICGKPDPTECEKCGKEFTTGLTYVCVNGIHQCGSSCKPRSDEDKPGQ